MKRLPHTKRITTSIPSNSVSLRRQGSNFSSGSGSRPSSAGRQQCNSIAEGGASSSMRLDSPDPSSDVNPAVAEALSKVAEAMAVAEETAKKVETLPSARLPTIVSFNSYLFFSIQIPHFLLFSFSLIIFPS